MPDETVGQRVARLRKERGLRITDLTGPGLSKGYVSRIEAGLRQPSVETLRLIAPKLDVSVEYLESGFDGVVLRLSRRAAEGLLDGLELPRAARRDLARQLGRRA